MAEIVKIKEFEDIKNLSDEDNKSLEKIVHLISEFWDVYACAIVKNGIPTGVALAPSSYEAKIKAIDCNPVESVGAIIAFSKEIDEQTAKSLYRMDFSTILTTKIEDNAKKYIEKCKGKVVEIGFRLDLYKKFLSENSDNELSPKGFKVATKLKPVQEQVEDMVFAWKVLKTIEKDAIVIAKDFKTSAIEIGSGVKAIEQAMDNACDSTKEAILASSKNIDDVKALHPAIQGRITGLIEPKNYENADGEILKMSDKYGITVITVGEE